MKLPKSLKVKETKKLFENKYNYKIVIITHGADFFRGKRYDLTYSNLKSLKNLSDNCFRSFSKLKDTAELSFCFKLLEIIKGFDKSLYGLRIEHPSLNFYTNQSSYIEKLALIDERHIKFVSIPNRILRKIDPGKVVVKTLDYGFKVYLGGIKNKLHINFIKWAENNNKIRLTNKCRRDLSKEYSYGGSYFYAKDEKTLLMAKMFLGSDISRIEEVIKG